MPCCCRPKYGTTQTRLPRFLYLRLKYTCNAAPVSLTKRRPPLHCDITYGGLLIYLSAMPAGMIEHTAPCKRFPIGSRRVIINDFAYRAGSALPFIYVTRNHARLSGVIFPRSRLRNERVSVYTTDENRKRPTALWRIFKNVPNATRTLFPNTGIPSLVGYGRVKCY